MRPRPRLYDPPKVIDGTLVNVPLDWINPELRNVPICNLWIWRIVRELEVDALDCATKVQARR